MYRDALQLMADHAIDGASRSDSGHIDPACRGYFQNVEPHFSFADGEGDVTVYYQDQIALLKRLEVIRRYRHLVRGITFWRLGGEDPASWTQIRQFKAGA